MTDHASLEGAIDPAENTRLFGHEATERSLAAAYRSGKLHHALLLEGPEGIGKATLAFRFANYLLNFPDPATAPEVLPDPDPTSSISRQIISGGSHHLLHLSRPMDEKSGKLRSAITIEEVRRAGKFFAQTSGSGAWRIAIVDPADDMNRNAANAILKMLEEPPKRSLFILISHSPGKLLPTIRSRCLTVKLTPLDNDAMQAALRHLRLEPGQEVLEMSKGSVSTALKIINHGGAEILETYHRVSKSNGAADMKTLHRLADVLAAKDAELIFQFFCEHVRDDLLQRAKDAARAHDIALSQDISRLFSELNEQLTLSQAYNLDRKQTVLNVVEQVRALQG